MCRALAVKGRVYVQCICSSWLPLKFGDCLIACSVMAGISIGSAGSGNPICKRDGGSSTCSVWEVFRFCQACRTFQDFQSSHFVWPEFQIFG